MKSRRIAFQLNDKTLGESKGLHQFLIEGMVGFEILIYLHSKGITKRNKNISDWNNLMTYFLFERSDVLQQAFEKGYALYGVNLGKRQDGNTNGPYQFSDFHYSGNFVAVNLKVLRDKIIKTPIDQDYFGVEGYWGKLCSYDKAYCAHVSSERIKNHYKEAYPESYYKDKT